MTEWTKRDWMLVTALGVVFVVLLVVANRITVGLPSRTTQDELARLATVAGALIALGALITAAVSTSLTGRRQKKQATLEAWTDWSQRAEASRRFLSSRLGVGVIGVDQADALVSPALDLRDKHGQVLDPDEKSEVAHSIAIVLNGLERLATGAKRGVYDRVILREISGTIIVRSYERLSPYIDKRRTAADPVVRQQKVFVALAELVTYLKRHELDSERLAQLREQSR